MPLSPLSAHQNQPSPQRPFPFFQPDLHTPTTRARPIVIQSIAARDPINPSSFDSQTTAMSGISGSLRTSPPLASSLSATATPFTIRTPEATGSSLVDQPLQFASIASPALPIDGLARFKPFPHNADLLGNGNEASGSRHQFSNQLSAQRHDEDTVMQDNVTAGGQSLMPQRIGRSSLAHYLDPPTPAVDDNRPSAYAQPFAPGHPWRFTSNEPSRAADRNSVALTPAAASAPHGQPSTSAARLTTTDNPPSPNELGPFRPWNQTRRSVPVYGGDPSMDQLHFAIDTYITRPDTHQADRFGRAGARTAAPVPISAVRAPQSNTTSWVSSAEYHSTSSAINSLPAPANRLPQMTSPGTLERHIDNIEARYDRMRQRSSRLSPTSPEFFPSHDNHRPRPYDLPSPAARSRPTTQTQSSIDPGRRSNSGRSVTRPSWLDIPSVPPPRMATMSPMDSSAWRPSASTSNPAGATTQTLTSYASYYEEIHANFGLPQHGPSVPATLPPSINAGGRSQHLQDRLNLLDAIRTGAQRPAPAGSQRLSQPIFYHPELPLRSGYDAPMSTEYRRDILNASTPATATASASTPAAAHAASPAGNVIRPVNRRWVSHDEGSREDERQSIGAWNRDVNDAIGRRLNPDSLVVQRDWESVLANAALPQQERNLARRTRSPALWGELANDSERGSNGTLPSPRIRTLIDPILGSGIHFDYLTDEASPVDEFGPGPSGLTMRHNPVAEVAALLGSDMQDSSAMYAYIHALRRSTPSPTHLKITPDMSQEETAKVVQLVVKGIGRVPPTTRRRAAESVLENVAWGAFGEREEMERDECCAVCHDDYVEEAEVSVTPCKHMYHKGCLNTWLKTPSTSSCPMCRRDLAVLACLTNIVPSKTREDAIPLWMAA